MQIEDSSLQAQNQVPHTHPHLADLHHRRQVLHRTCDDAWRLNAHLGPAVGSCAAQPSSFAFCFSRPRPYEVHKARRIAPCHLHGPPCQVGSVMAPRRAGSVEVKGGGLQTISHGLLVLPMRQHRPKSNHAYRTASACQLPIEKGARLQLCGAGYKAFITSSSPLVQRVRPIWICREVAPTLPQHHQEVGVTILLHERCLHVQMPTPLPFAGERHGQRRKGKAVRGPSVCANESAETQKSSPSKTPIQEA